MKTKMRISTIDIRNLQKAAIGEIPCDMTLSDVKIVNMLTGEIYPGEVDLLGKRIVRVRRDNEKSKLKSLSTFSGKGKYLLPGSIDTHVHVESSMMTPSMFSRAVVPWGTTTVCTDPHEIANVMGIDGISFMLQNAEQERLRQYVLAPSCVPSKPCWENSGAEFTNMEVEQLLQTEGVIGIAEIMDYQGVVSGDSRMTSIVKSGFDNGAFLQGHGPMLSGEKLAAYRLGGPMSDHESNSPEEIRERLRMGFFVDLRSSSIVDCLEQLADGFSGMKWLDNVSLCTDDVHAADIEQSGHINRSVARLIKCGKVDPVTGYKLCTLNAAREYGFHDLGAVAPGYLADLQLLDELDGRKPYAVFIGGQLAAFEGRYIPKDDGNASIIPEKVLNTVHVPDLVKDDLLLKCQETGRKEADVFVMQRIPGNGIVRNGNWEKFPVGCGAVDVQSKQGTAYVSVINRHGMDCRTIAVTRDFSMKEGSIASTVSHDCHNMTIIYRDEESALACVNMLRREGGGFCAAKNGKCIEMLSLPVAGLMANEECASIAGKINRMEKAMQSLCNKPVSMLDIATYALPVVPGIVITDEGVFDTDTGKKIDVIKQ